MTPIVTELKCSQQQGDQNPRAALMIPGFIVDCQSFLADRPRLLVVTEKIRQIRHCPERSCARRGPRAGCWKAEERLCPRPTFQKVAPYVPEPRECPDEAQATLDIMLLEQPGKRGPEIVVLWIEPQHPGCLVSSIELGRRPLCKIEQVI